MNFGESLINIFVPIYLYTLGFSVHKILFFYLLASMYFLILAYPVAKIVAKIGEKHAILVSTPFISVYYLGLIILENYAALFYILPLLLALRSVFFNYGYHLNFISHADRKNIGEELAFIGILTVVATVLAPYFGGLLASVNFKIVLVSSSVLLFFAKLPLLFSKDKHDILNISMKKLFFRTISNKKNLLSFSGSAIEASIGKIIWPIYVLLIVGTVSRAGFIISFSMFISVLVFFFIGHATDHKNKIMLLRLGTLLYFFAWIGRIFVNSRISLFFLETYKNITEKLIEIPWNAHCYYLAKKNSHFEFIVSREMAYNFAIVLVLPLLVLVFWLNVYPFFFVFLIGAVSSLGYSLIKS